MAKNELISKSKGLGLVAATSAVLIATSGIAKAQDFAGGIDAGSDTAAGTTQAGTSLFGAGGLFRTITNILLFLVGAISVIMLVIGGIRYVVSGGDQQAVTNAKNTILYAIVGIVVAFLAYAAVAFVSSQLEAGVT